MSTKARRLAGALLAAAALLALWMPAARANSAEPPRVVVYFSGGVPDDLTLSVVLEDGTARPMQAYHVAWERYDLYLRGFEDAQVGITALRMRTGGSEADLSLAGMQMNTYSNVFTLNVAEGRLSQGKSLARGILLVALRVALTLIIEAGVFWLFGYRLRRSYVVFLCVNLVTQGVLNAVLSTALYPTGYEIFGLVAGEIVVFAAEMIAMPLLLREHGKPRAVLYALAANAASLVLGGVMLAYLPL